MNDVHTRFTEGDKWTDSCYRRFKEEVQEEEAPSSTAPTARATTQAKGNGRPSYYYRVFLPRAQPIFTGKLVSYELQEGEDFIDMMDC